MRSLAVSISLAVATASFVGAAPGTLKLSHAEATFGAACRVCHALGILKSERMALPIRSTTMFGFGTAIWNQGASVAHVTREKKIEPAPLSGADLEELFLYTQVMADPRGRGSAPAGKEFLEKNRCLTCHRVGGQGGDKAPALDRFANHVHPATLVSRLWAHRGAMLDRFKKLGVPLPRPQPGDLGNLLAYLRSAGDPPPGPIVLINQDEIGIGPEEYTRSGCERCHEDSFQAAPGLSLPAIADALLTHAFLPEQNRPPYDQVELSPSDVLRLSLWVFYQAKRDETGDAARGLAVFAERCAKCHADGGKAGKLEVPIDGIESPWDFFAKVFAKSQSQGVDESCFPRLSAEEVRDLYAYLVSE